MRSYRCRLDVLHHVTVWSAGVSLIQVSSSGTDSLVPDLITLQRLVKKLFTERQRASAAGELMLPLQTDGVFLIQPAALNLLPLLSLQEKGLLLSSGRLQQLVFAAIQTAPL